MFSLKVFLIFTVALFVILVLEQVIPTVVELDFGYYYNYLPIKLIFISIAITSLVIQYIIIGYIKKSYEGKDKRTRIPILVIQSVITVLMIVVILNVIQNPRYGSPNLSQLLGGIISISYGTAVFFFCLLAYRFLKKYKEDLKITSLLYGLSFSIITINAILNCISNNIFLGNLRFLSVYVPDSCLQFESPPNCTGMELSLDVTWITVFILLWASSVLFLYSNKSNLGKKFWILIFMPITLPIYEIFLLLGIHIIHLFGIFIFIQLYFVLHLVSRFIPAYAFGASFCTVNKAVILIGKQEFSVIAGIGLFLYLLSINQYSLLSVGTFHPLSGIPYGSVTLSLVGLFAYMISIIQIDYLFE